MQNPQQVILSQFLSSPVLLAILNNWNTNLDPRVDLALYFTTVWNVSTASGYGLDVLGRIVGVTRSIAVQPSGVVFGFSEGVGWTPFNDSPFAGVAPNGVLNETLSDASFRTLILLKAQANISNCSAASLNTILFTLFGTSGNAYAIDNGGMAATARFVFTPTPEQTAIILQSNVIPRPSGVLLNIVTGP